MKDINEVHLLGRIAGDVASHTSTKGTTYCAFSVVTNYVKKGNNGDIVRYPTFHNLVAFGDIANEIAETFNKGKLIELWGSLSVQSYEKNQMKRYITKIIVSKYNEIDSSTPEIKKVEEKPHPEQADIPSDKDDADLPF